MNVIIKLYETKKGVIFLLKIRELRKIRNMTARELAKQVGVAESTMSLYEHGKREPDFDTLRRIAQCLGTDIDYLLGVSPEIKRSGAKRIPVFGSVAAGIPIEAITDIEDYEEISDELAESGEFVALRIKGNSMEPLLCPGDTVIVRVQNTIESGDIAIVLVGGDEATCKKIQKTPEGVLLISLNSSYQPMFYTNSQIEALPILIFGKVVELRRSF